MKRVRVTQYDLELDEFKHPVLVEVKKITCLQKEEQFGYRSVTEMLSKCYKLTEKAEEYLYAVAYTAGGGLLGVFEVAHGRGSGARINFRELMQRLLLVGAGGFVLAHNHPGGNLQPSQADMEGCGATIAMGDFHGIPCLDFIIVGRDFESGERLSLSFKKEKLMGKVIEEYMPILRGMEVEKDG